MGDKNDELKYMEGNYSIEDPGMVLAEWWEDTKQAQKLSQDAEYMKKVLEYLKEKEEEHHYLVDGATITCTKCKMEPDTYYGSTFTAPEGSDERKLKVTHNTSYVNGAGQYFATVKDIEFEPFGNCDNPPDREAERKALMLAAESEELCKYGTCRYLMDLNDEWENWLSNTGYQEVTELNGDSVETVTMEAILFCKHGGFIRPINSGYIKTDDEPEIEIMEKATEEEISESLKQIGITNTDVAIYVWQFFRNEKFSEYAVAGIMGNVYAESKFNPEIVRNETYYGLFQIGDGADKMLKQGGIEGWKDVDFQCRFALCEYNGSDTGWQVRYLDMGDYMLCSSRENFQNAANATEAALLWGTGFERAYVSKRRDSENRIIFDKLQHQEERIQWAEDIYKVFEGKGW